MNSKRWFIFLSSRNEIHGTLARFRKWTPELLFLAATTMAGLLARGRWLTPMADTGCWWSLFYRLSRGEHLYRGVYPLQYGPLSPYLLALGAKVFGPTATFFLLATWISGIAAGLLLLRVARLLVPNFVRVGVAGLIIGTSVLAPGPGRLVFSYAPGAVHALAFSMAALLSLETNSERRQERALLAGCFAGLAFIAKQEIGLSAAIAISVSVFVMSGKRVASFLRSAAGFLMVVGPAVLFLLSSSSVRSLREDSHVWPLVPVPTGQWGVPFRRLAGLSIADWPWVLRSSAWGLLCLIGAVATLALLTAGVRKLSHWKGVFCLLSFVMIWWMVDGSRLWDRFRPISLSMSVALLVLFLAFLRRDLSQRVLLVGLSSFAVLTGARTAFSMDLGSHYSGVGHFASAVTWAVLVGVLAPKLLCSGERGFAHGAALFGMGFLAIAWATAIPGLAGLSPVDAEEVPTRQGPIFVGSKYGPFFRRISGAVRSGERALVVPEINALDVLFGVQSASPYLFFHPAWLDSKTEERLIARFEKEPPEVVVLFDRPALEWGVAPFGQGYGRRLADWVFRHYRIVESCPGGLILRPQPFDVVSVRVPPI